jgi:hypothetical protein
VASTPRRFDRQSNKWVDGEALFLRCSAWNDLGEHVAESLTRGAKVLVVGRLVQHSYETQHGEKRTVVEVQADDVGASLVFAPRRSTGPTATAVEVAVAVAVSVAVLSVTIRGALRLPEGLRSLALLRASAAVAAATSRPSDALGIAPAGVSGRNPRSLRLSVA